MKKIVISNGLEIAPVALGAMNFGTTTSKEDAYRVLDAYVDMGGNFIDTSNNYAHWAGTGDESETLLGEWLRDRNCRDRVVIATKVGFDRHGEGAGLKKEQIEYWIDESLRKLGTDYVDLYYAHTDDPTTSLEETMDAFHSLIEKGNHFCTTCGASVPLAPEPAVPQPTPAPVTPRRREPARPVRRPKKSSRWTKLWEKLDDEKVKRTVLISGCSVGGVAILVFLIGFAF